MAMRAHVSIAAAALVASCSESEPVTELVLYIEAEPSVAAKMDMLSINVFDAQNTDAGSFAYERVRWSGAYSVSLTPRAGRADTRVAIEVEALDDRKVISTSRVVTSYVLNERRFLRLVLPESCGAEVVCSAEQTCLDGVCQTAYVEPESLGKDPDAAPRNIDLVEPPRSPRDGGIPDAAFKLDGSIFAIPEAGLIIPILDASLCTTSEIREAVEDIATGEERRRRDLTAFCIRPVSTCNSTLPGGSGATGFIPADKTICSSDGGFWTIQWDGGVGAAYEGLSLFPEGGLLLPGADASTATPRDAAVPFATIVRREPGVFDVNMASRLPLPTLQREGTCTTTVLSTPKANQTTATVKLCPR